MNTELISKLKSMNPTEGEWEIDGHKRIFLTANKLDLAEILTPNDNDINLILLAPSMREELLKMEEEISSKPEPFTPEMWNYLLVNALKFLNEEQIAGLCFDLYSRSSLKSEIDNKIKLNQPQP